MSQPTAYNRVTSFTTVQQEFPTSPLPGDDLDAELNAVKQTLDEVLNNLALIQRDDGALANRSVGLDQLASDVEIGFNAPTIWASGTAYKAFDAVFRAARFYRCLVAHTASASFDTDLAALKWELIADFTLIGSYWTATSTTSQVIGTGTKSFTVEADRFFLVGDYVTIVNDADNWMSGRVTAYSGSNLTVEVDETDGSGTLASWTIHLSGRRGQQGIQGDAATVQIGTVTTGDAGTSASVTNSGTSGAAVLDFTIPQGAKGDPGEVTSTGTFVAGNLAKFSDTTGDVIEDAGVAVADLVSGPASSTTGNLPKFADTTGKVFSDSGVAAASLPTVSGTPSNGQVAVFTGAATIQGQSAATARATLGLVIGTDVQAFDAQLSSNIPQVSKSEDYTLALTDAEKHILHPSTATTAHTFTIPDNSSVSFPIGTAITFVNQNGAGTVTIAITTDTMRLAGTGSTGSRTLASNGIATALKITSTEWIISGTGLT